jgi:hypothetical protein
VKVCEGICRRHLNTSKDHPDKDSLILSTPPVYISRFSSSFDNSNFGNLIFSDLGAFDNISFALLISAPEITPDNS